MANQDKFLEFINTLSPYSVFTIKTIAKSLYHKSSNAILKSITRGIKNNGLDFNILEPKLLIDEHQRPAKKLVLRQLLSNARKKRKLILFGQIFRPNRKTSFLALNDSRGGRRWIKLENLNDIKASIQQALIAITEFEKKKIVLIPSDEIVITIRKLVKENPDQLIVSSVYGSLTAELVLYSQSISEVLEISNDISSKKTSKKLTHLDKLEAESIYIMREVMAEAQNPVMLYSIGKDSSVMLHLARKAFYPSPPPFPLLHIDTCWKFQAMYEFRDYMAKTFGMKLLVYTNPDGLKQNINPFDHGSTIHTDIMKTQSLKMALDYYKFDVAFGGARRDEEKSRAKERVFSFRTSTHNWDPKNQRPELWNLYNGKKNENESIRVFPISNWTELDIWQYIYREQIPIVPLYFAAKRPVVVRENNLILMLDDDRFQLYKNEEIKYKMIRFRTLGCYPLTGAIESNAFDLASIILEVLSSKYSERQGRAIDTDTNSSMEKKKQEGYF